MLVEGQAPHSPWRSHAPPGLWAAQRCPSQSDGQSRHEKRGQCRRPSAHLSGRFAVGAARTLAVPASAGGTRQCLRGGADLAYPAGGVVSDEQGNLYGVTRPGAVVLSLRLWRGLPTRSPAKHALPLKRRAPMFLGPLRNSLNSKIPLMSHVIPTLGLLFS